MDGRGVYRAVRESTGIQFYMIKAAHQMRNSQENDVFSNFVNITNVSI